MLTLEHHAINLIIYFNRLTALAQTDVLFYLQLVEAKGSHRHIGLVTNLEVESCPI